MAVVPTDIGWCHRTLLDGTIIKGYTFNTHHGCFKVSPGCKFCYAEGIAKRWGWQNWGPAETTDRRLFSDAHWNEPFVIQRRALKLGHRISVFTNSMSDLFEKHRDLDPVRARLWQIIETTPWINWILLTKRPENIEEMVPWKGQFPDNVWIGTSVENQHYADLRLPYLVALHSRVAVTLCSYEPALGLVDFTRYLPKLDWLIGGGESGPEHRPLNPDWMRSARNQCLEYRAQTGRMIHFFFKQWGGLHHNSGGRLLDGRTWDEMPPEEPEIWSPPLIGELALRQVRREWGIE